VEADEIVADAKRRRGWSRPEAPSRPEQERHVGSQDAQVEVGGKGLMARREERPPTRALRGSVSAEPGTAAAFPVLTA
jgi:hypothetical protein